MFRTASHTALILKSRPSGESNREVWLLTAEAGLIRATVFGGPKSRLRALAAPFNSGRVWVYHDPVKDSRKISDFDVQSWRPGLRELYERSMAAGAVAETVLASHGGGGHWEEVLSLAEAALDALAEAGEEACSRIPVFFYWRWAGFLGLDPSLDYCVACGGKSEDSAALWYSPRESGMVCGGCISAQRREGEVSGFVFAGPGCRHWLKTVRPLDPSRIVRHTMDKKSFQEAKSLTTAILAEALGKRLSSWDW
ncbi:MAG: DNA repair protein RecO [Treponema sp.]|jgi:DNA repair protein RecO (recombination protein O)|nr:DNA repair protein RecO [Treponema sp.]